MAKRLFVLTFLAAACGDDGVHHLADAPLPPGSWLTTSELPVARTHAVAAAPGNGFVYMINGYINNAACNSGTADGRVLFAKQNTDGTLGAWTESTVANVLRSIPGHAEANGYIYLAGGAKNGPSWDGAVWFAKPATDGNIATWTQATNVVPGADVVGSAPLVAVESNMLYVGGGFYLSGGAQNSVHLYRATLDAGTGQPGTWTQLADLPTASTNGQLAFSADHAYLFTGTDQVYVAPLGAGGPTGWHATTTLPVTPYYPNVQFVGGRLYVIPGQMPGSGPADVYVSTPQPDGELGPWSIHNQAPAQLAVGYQGVYTNGYYYALGYDDCFASTDVPAATLAKTSYYCPL